MSATVEPKTTVVSREECYKHRDAFYACLDAAADDRTKCAAESEAYDKACMKSWRRYFDDRRKHGKAQLAVARFETDGSK